MAKKGYDSTRMKNDLENGQKHSVAFDTYISWEQEEMYQEIPHIYFLL